MRAPIQLLIAEPKDFSPRAIRILERFAEVDLRECSRDDMRTALAEYDVVWFRLGHRIDRDLLNGQTRCRMIATPVTGIDHVDLWACAERGIRVVSLRGEFEFLKRVRATAELTVGLTLALLRHIPRAAESVISGQWDRDLFRGRELFDKTAGIVGMGRLGRIVSEYLRAFGMNVVGYDPRPDFPTETARRVRSLFELLEQSDVVSIHVKYDDTTRHLFRHQHFQRMKPGAVLVNTSRGGIVDDQALLDALESGHLGGAALDVLDGEPRIARDHPLVTYAREHDNLLIVPHIGGNTVESFEKTESFLALRVMELVHTGALASPLRV